MNSNNSLYFYYARFKDFKGIKVLSKRTYNSIGVKKMFKHFYKLIIIIESFALYKKLSKKTGNFINT